MKKLFIGIDFAKEKFDALSLQSQDKRVENLS